MVKKIDAVTIAFFNQLPTFRGFLPTPPKKGRKEVGWH